MAIAAAPRSMPSSFSAIRPPKEWPIKIGWARQAIDNLRIVVGDVVDSLVGDAIRVGVGGIGSVGAPG